MSLNGRAIFLASVIRHDTNHSDDLVKKWMVRSALSGFSPAAEPLGIYHEDGFSGFVKSNEQAYYWHSLLGDDSTANARLNAAMMLCQGDGVKKDSKKSSASV